MSIEDLLSKGREEAVARSVQIDGWMTQAELEWLYEQATMMRSIVEVGSWKGRSTSALCAGCRGSVYAVDPFVGFGEQSQLEPYPIFLENMASFPNCVPIRCLSRYAGGTRLCPPEWNVDGAGGDPRIPPMVDMVFLDGEHAYHDVLMDLHVWMPRTTRLICGHDQGHPGVRQALAEFFTVPIQSAKESIWCVWK